MKGVSAMKLTCLGVNGPYPAANGATSGYLITAGGARIQLDMGSGVLAALTSLTDPEKLSAVLLSHWHYDHACDLLPLTYRLTQPLEVYAPVQEDCPIRTALLANPLFRVHDVHPGDRFALGDVQVQVGEARHPVPAVMYRLTHQGRTLCYTGDTNTLPGLADFARDCDLLLADGLFPAAAWSEEKPHLSAALAAQLAKDAGAGKVILTHLNPSIDALGLLKEARTIRRDAVLAARFAVYDV